MKPSSSDPVTPAEPVAAEPVVVPARLDRPLNAGAIGHGWAHPQIEQQIARARADAAESARSEGYAAGWAQGRRAAAEAAAAQGQRADADAARRAELAAARLEQLLASLDDAVRRADVAAEPAWAQVADAVVDGAIGIARAVLARELGSVGGPTVEALRTAVRCLGGPGEVTVHVHPSDVALLDSLPDVERPAALRVVADPDQPPGTVTTSTPAQTVVVNMPAALAAAQEVLRS
jgi:flagellar assembly protein FliH